MGSDKKEKRSVEEKQRQETFVIQPSNDAPSLSTADWPLLLKVSFFQLFKIFCKYFFDFSLERTAKL